jgi:hypothetical protein
MYLASGLPGHTRRVRIGPLPAVTNRIFQWNHRTAIGVAFSERELHILAALSALGFLSRRTRSSLSRTSADGLSRASTSRCLPTEPRCSGSRRVESLRSQWGFAIPTSTARSSARRRAEVTDPLP